MLGATAERPPVVCDAPRRLHEWELGIGGISLHITSPQCNDLMLYANLQPFQISSDTFDVEISVETVTDLVSPSSQRLFDSGTTWSLIQNTTEFVFDFSDASFGPQPYKRLMIDPHFTCGTLQLSQKAFSPYIDKVSPFGYPLDELLIMHRLTQEKAIELHGTGIVRRNGDANLFVGHSGAGKSTTTRLWTAIEDVEVLSDDRIIVRRDENNDVASEEGRRVDEPGILRLRDRSALPTGHSAQDDKPKYPMRMYGTPWHGEAMFASPNSAPLTRIFVLEHGHGNVITPLSPSKAVAELFARSFVPFHRHEYVESALVFLEELANAVPVYRYAFEPDRRAVEKILHFHD